MAITLSVALNDTEQARIVEVAALVAPNATPAQVKAWAEGVCKEALRVEVRRLALEAQREAENLARRSIDEAWTTDWPEPVVDQVEPSA